MSVQKFTASSHKFAASICLKPVVALVLMTSMTSSLFAQDKPGREEFMSDAGFVVGTYSPQVTKNTPQEIVAAASRLLELMSDEQREQAEHQIDSPERQKWTNSPARGNAGGIAIGNLSQKQVEALCDLLASVTSEHGYQKITEIMLGDDLRSFEHGRRNSGVGIEAFRLVLFGQPDDEKPWGLQLDGHHIAFNVSIEGDKFTMSPSFFGTRPDTFKAAGREMQPLMNEVELAHQLVQNLSDEQRLKAVVDNKRGRIQTGPGTDGRVPHASGISVSEMTDSQQQLLLNLIQEWVQILPPKHAEIRMEQIKQDLEKTKFSWNGAIKKGSDISYSIIGPTLAVEFACQDMGDNPLEHLHSMYRDPTNEYGGQLDTTNESKKDQSSVAPIKKVAFLNPTNTQIGFVGRHTGEKPRPRIGGFRDFTGRLFLTDSGDKLEKVFIDIDMDSVWTEFTGLTDHLKGKEFFDVKQFRNAHFESNKVKQISDSEWQITGNLTLHGITNEIKVPAKLQRDVKGVGLHCEFKIDRTSFGLDQMTGGVAKEVSVEVIVGEPTQTTKPKDGNGNDLGFTDKTVEVPDDMPNGIAVTFYLPNML